MAIKELILCQKSCPNAQVQAVKKLIMMMFRPIGSMSSKANSCTTVATVVKLVS